MDGTKARQIVIEISPSFTVSHISRTAEHVSMYISVFHTIASNVKTIQKDPTDVTKGRETIEFPYFGKDLGMENANKTHEQASWDHVTT